jgi:hypothetical protein
MAKPHNWHESGVWLDLVDVKWNLISLESRPQGTAAGLAGTRTVNLMGGFSCVGWHARSFSWRINSLCEMHMRDVEKDI